MILLYSTGASKNSRQLTICVVNKYGFKVSKKETSSVAIMVNKIITAMVLMMGPIELLLKHDSMNDNAATESNAM